MSQVTPSFAAAVVRDWRRPLACAVVLALLGLVVALVQPPIYESRATVLFPQDQGNLLLGAIGLGALRRGDEMASLDGTTLGLGPGRLPTIETAAAILESRTAADQVAAELDLKSRWRLPDEREASRQLERRVKVRKNVLDGEITVLVRTGDAELSQQVVSRYLEVYHRYTQGTVLTRAKRQRIFLEEQVAESDARLREAEKRLTEYEEVHGASLASSTPGSVSTLVGELYSERILAAARAREAEARVDELRRRQLESAQALQGDSNRPSPSADVVVGTLQNELTAARLELARLRLFRTEDNPDVQALESRIAGIESLLESKLRSMSEAYSTGLSPELISAEAELRAARARLDAAVEASEREDERLSGVPPQAMGHIRLKREFELEEAINRMLRVELQRSRVAEVRESMDLEVLDAPQVPDKPVLPSKKLYMALGLALGLFLGLTWSCMAALLAPLAAELRSLQGAGGD